MSNSMNIIHQLSKSHVTEFATSMAASSGPDGMVHLIFYRDALVIESEDIHAPDEAGMAALVQGQSIVTTSTANMKHIREDVATIIIQKSALENFAKLFETLSKG